MTPESITFQLQSYDAEIAALELAKTIVATLGDKLTDSCRLSPQGVFWVHCNKREDLQTLMTLAPQWRKSGNVDCIDYQATVQGIPVTIKAESAALPGTCKMVEEEYVIPAVEAQPSKVGKRMVLRCEQPVSEAVAVSLPETVHVGAGAVSIEDEDIPL